MFVMHRVDYAVCLYTTVCLGVRQTPVLSEVHIPGPCVYPWIRLSIHDVAAHLAAC